MELVPYTDADLWLTEALETDPLVMRELGGARPRDEIAPMHQRRMEAIAHGAWYFKIVPEPGGPVVGSVTIWRSEWRGEPISEAGWMILPEYQGRGYASGALKLLLERARADGRWGDIHAFAGTTNVPSNALCRRFGFKLMEEVDVDFRDRSLRCNHWLLTAGG